MRSITFPEAAESELNFGLKIQCFGALFSASVMVIALHPRLPAELLTAIDGTSTLIWHL